MALKVALAYSGGLDTSVIARWLIEQLPGGSDLRGGRRRPAGWPRRVAGKGARHRCRGLPRRRRARGFRVLLRLADAARGGGLRAQVSAGHLHGAAAHRAPPGGGGAGPRAPTPFRTDAPARATTRSASSSPTGRSPRTSRSSPPGANGTSPRARTPSPMRALVASRLTGVDEGETLFMRRESLAHLLRGRPARGPHLRARKGDVPVVGIAAGRARRAPSAWRSGSRRDIRFPSTESGWIRWNCCIVSQRRRQPAWRRAGRHRGGPAGRHQVPGRIRDPGRHHPVRGPEGAGGAHPAPAFNGPEGPRGGSIRGPGLRGAAGGRRSERPSTRWWMW